MNKRFHVFDAQMAEITAEAFSQGNNSYMHEFWRLFENLWIRNVTSPDINRIESIAGFNILRELLSGQMRETSADGKQITLRHIQDFIESVDSLISSYTGEEPESNR